MAAGDPGGGLVPVERAELVTRDVDLLAEQLREAYYDHTARFRAWTPPGSTPSCVRPRPGR